MHISTKRDGIEIKPLAARISVIVCATVNELAIFTKGQN